MDKVLVGGLEWDWFVTQLNGRDVVLLVSRDLGETVSGTSWEDSFGEARLLVNTARAESARTVEAVLRAGGGPLDVPAAEAE